MARSETNETNDTNTESGEEAWVGGLDRGTASRNPLPRGDENGPIRLGLDYHGTVGEQLEHIVEEGASITVILILLINPVCLLTSFAVAQVIA